MTKVELAERLATLEHHVNENFFEIQRRLDELIKFQDRAKSNFLEVERKLVQFEQKAEHHAVEKVTEKVVETTDISRLEEKIKTLEDVIMLLEIEVVKTKDRAETSEVGVTPTVPTKFEDRLMTIEEKLHLIEKLKLKVPVELVQHEPRLSAIENNILSVQRQMKEEVGKLESMIGGRAVTEQSAERFVTKLREEMNELRREIEKAQMLKHEIVAKERSFATRPDLESFEARIRSDVEHVHDITDKLTSFEKSLDGKLINIEEKLEQSVKNFKAGFKKEIDEHKNDITSNQNKMVSSVNSWSEIIKNLKNEVDSIQESFDSKAATIEASVRNEAKTNSRLFDNKIADIEGTLRAEVDAHRRAFDSKIVNMEETLAKVAVESASNEARKDVDAALSKHRNEVNMYMQKVNSIERDLESRATSVVTKELSAFAEAIDKRFPDLVSKSTFADWSTAVAQRIQTIEAPDITPIVERVDNLELRVEEVSTLIKEVVYRMPIVVE